jgi:hypothetical protein
MKDEALFQGNAEEENHKLRYRKHINPCPESMS